MFTYLGWGFMSGKDKIEARPLSKLDVEQIEVIASPTGVGVPTRLKRLGKETDCSQILTKNDYLSSAESLREEHPRRTQCHLTS